MHEHHIKSTFTVMQVKPTQVSIKHHTTSDCVKDILPSCMSDNREHFKK